MALSLLKGRTLLSSNLRKITNYNFKVTRSFNTTAKMFKLSEDLIKQLDPKVLEGFDVENLEAITISDKMWRQLKSMMNEEEEEEGESGVQLTDEEIENYSRDSQMNMDPLLSKTYPKMASPSTTISDLSSSSSSSTSFKRK
eukprot:TRINITY_DN1736_c0_g1_i4.p1 TRINITY_DN1736_c0_g1~~TRINITY_DN1736_c0_g1_i4.p1  ORF type:complete len:149 (-),score=39.50 TRINITY_DN1736_c0_g1_i4:27-452(-)